MAALGSRLVAWRRSELWLRCGPAAAVAVVIILTNLPALVGIVQANPINVAGTTGHLGASPLPGAWSIDPNVGTSQAMGHLAALDWLHGRVPWWNPFEGIGSPLAAGIQSAAFFPPVLLFALANGSLYFHVFLELICGLATYFLVRELGMSRGVSSAGGIVFGLNGTMAWLSNAPMNPVAFLPLMLLGIEMAYKRRDSDAGWVVLALALALAVYAGFPETTYLDMLLPVVWAGVRLLQSGRGSRMLLTGRLVGGAACGALLSLPVAVPFLEYLSGAYVGHHAAGHLSSLSLKQIHLALLGLPYLYGPIKAFDGHGTGLETFWGLAGGFVTAGTIVLAIVGLFGARRERTMRYALGGLLVVVMLWQFGVSPFAAMTRIVPFLSQVWVVRYLAPLWELAFVVMACFGLETLGSDRRARTAAVGAGVAALVGGALMFRTGLAARAANVSSIDPGAHVYALVTWLSAVFVVVALTVGSALRRSRGTVAAVAALFVIEAAVAAGVPQFSAPRSASVDTAPVAFLRAHVDYGRFFAFGLYVGDYGSYFGLSQLDETDLPVPAAWANEISAHLGNNTYPVNFDGVQVISPSGASPAAQALANFDSYERLGVRYFVVPTANPLFGLGPKYPDGMRLVFRDSFVTILALPHPSAYFSAISTSGGRCSVTPESRDVVTTVCTAASTLVRSELDLAGWSVTVNGRPAPVIDDDGLLTAVRVPTGHSVVSFQYAPPNINLAVGGFAVGAVAVVGLPSWRRRRRRRREPATPTSKRLSRIGVADRW